MFLEMSTQGLNDKYMIEFQSEVLYVPKNIANVKKQKESKIDTEILNITNKSFSSNETNPKNNEKIETEENDVSD